MLVYMYFLTNPITSFFYLAVFTPAISHYRSFIKHCDFCFNDWSKKKKFHFSELLINLMARKKLILKNLIACFVAKPIPRTAHWSYHQWTKVLLLSCATCWLQQILSENSSACFPIAGHMRDVCLISTTAFSFKQKVTTKCSLWQTRW